MAHLSPIRRAVLTFLVFVLPVFAFGATAEVGHTSAEMREEVQTFLALLEQVHYNRNAVQPSDYIRVLPDYMSAIDGQKLFFLSTDKTDFEKRYSPTLYYNMRSLGSIDVAYQIFALYRQRMQDRVAWVLKELDKPIDLNTHEFYRIDRSKSDWPENMAAADALWRRRLKFEIISEMLGKKTLEQAKDIVRKRYQRMLKNVSEIDNTEIAETFLTSFAGLYDPHSAYLSAESFEDFDIQMKLQLVGIGAVLSLDEDKCVVREIVPGGPADLDNRLKPNDKIIAVAQGNGEPVDIIGMQLRKIVNLIRGGKGTKVRLIVQPANTTDASARKEIVLTRDVVKLNSARAFGAVFQVPSDDGKTTVPIGVISLPAFYGGFNDDGKSQTISASNDVAALIKRLKEAHVQGIVLDLRNNGGGLLAEAINVTGLFIGHGPVVQVRNYNGGIDVDSDDDPSVAYKGPLAVLVDRGSASASEIVTGALQNYGRAIIIGDKSTHGKGTVQNIFDIRRFLPPDLPASVKTGAVRLTIQKFYLPSGASTQLKGVTPDIVINDYEDYLPIGEGDLPHALAWDEIPSSFYDGAPIPPSVLGILKSMSLERQKTLPEFAYLRKSVNWFKDQQEKKLVSLNLAEREKEKADNSAFRKASKAEAKALEKNAYAYTEVRLVPKPPKPKIAKDKSDNSGDDDFDDADSNESFGKTDVQLREALRVVRDAVDLGHNTKLWNHSYEPLTEAAVESRYGK
ncbi:tail-specific protease precursor [mine drainage metagenome]|uniref:Tail-specific protease n=1 Tax=mine drainage metagenome TaxID=410659 RepID=A0A1J5S800_9ZZZZ